MEQLLGFVIVYGALALVIGTITKAGGALRIVAFSVLTAFALISGYPAIRNALESLIQGTPQVVTTVPGDLFTLRNILASVVIFGIVGTLIGMLVKGTLRWVGFAILAVMALFTLSTTPGQNFLTSLPVPFFPNATRPNIDGSVPSNTGTQQVPQNTGQPGQPGQGSSTQPTQPGNIAPGNGQPIAPGGGTTPPGTTRPQQPRPGLPALW